MQNVGLFPHSVKWKKDRDIGRKKNNLTKLPDGNDFSIRNSLSVECLKLCWKLVEPEFDELYIYWFVCRWPKPKRASNSISAICVNNMSLSCYVYVYFVGLGARQWFSFSFTSFTNSSRLFFVGWFGVACGMWKRAHKNNWIQKYFGFVLAVYVCLCESVLRVRFVKSLEDFPTD